MSDEPQPNSDLILYQTEDGRTRIQCRFENETVWLTQQHMAELFQTTKQNVGQHLKSLFAEGELVQDSVVKDSFTTAADGKNYATKFYNLDVIISVGYRVRSLGYAIGHGPQLAPILTVTATATTTMMSMMTPARCEP